MNDLTLMCISKVDAYASQFLLTMQDLARQLGCEFVIGADGKNGLYRANAQFHYSRVISVESKGYLESVHDQIVDACSTPYVLRLDDDEKASTAMVDWLMDRAYRVDDHWKFSRAHLWTPTTFINASPLWPDHQTRLSVKAKMKGRTSVHCGSPFGGGRLAPVAIEHYKFLVKTHADRLKIADTYDSIEVGLGSKGMLVFNVPEDVYPEIPTEPWGDGTVT